MTPSLPLALLAPVLGSAVGRRCATYRATSRWLWVLAGLSGARLLAGALRGAAVTPYTGSALAAWATREAAGLAWGWCAAAMVWGVLKSQEPVSSQGNGLSGRTMRRVCEGQAVAASALQRTLRVPSPGPALATLACLALLSTLYLAYPHLRGVRWTWLVKRFCFVMATAQVAIGASWLAGRWSKNNFSLSLAHWVGLIFCGGAAWDMAGAYAPWADLIKDWWITQYGNVIFWSIICVTQAVYYVVKL